MFYQKVENTSAGSNFLLQYRCSAGTQTHAPKSEKTPRETAGRHLH
jgi:hypothetical protein